MSNFAIVADGLGKRYQIGEREPYKTLRDTLTNAIYHPIRMLRAPRVQPNGKPNRQFWALKDVSFTIAEGETVGIIGRNGAGKSTLLRILSRITEPTLGEATIRGRVNSLLEVGTGFHQELTGRENIFLNGSILGMRRSEIRRKLEEIVAFAGVEQFIDTPVKFYSSGMFVRLAFAVAAHLEPEILLVDEVLAVGDLAFQKKCLGKMEGMTAEGRTVVLVSHNMAAIKSLCRRSLWIDSGRLLAQGESHEVIMSYVGAVAAEMSDSEIPEEKHVTGTSKLRVRRVRFIGGHEGALTVFWKQPIELALEFQVREDIKEVSFGLGVSTLDGVQVFTIHHNDDATPLWSLDRGDYVLRVTLDNPLRAGTYRLGLGAHEGIAKTSIFYIPDALQFNVLDIASGNDHYIHHNSGLVDGRAGWSLNST